MLPDDPPALSDQFHDWLLSYARMLDVDRAEDAVQEAFAALISRQRRPPPVENAKGYLVRVVQRSVVRRRRLPFRLPASQDHYDRYPDPDLASAIASLPPRQQACLALRFGHDLTIAAIAEHLDVTESTVRSYLARALDRLGELLGEGP
ncbi:MAG: sigma-70 family RNA polymerase sigma factor [Actinomycetota bacterium]